MPCREKGGAALWTGVEFAACGPVWSSVLRVPWKCRMTVCVEGMSVRALWTLHSRSTNVGAVSLLTIAQPAKRLV